MDDFLPSQRARTLARAIVELDPIDPSFARKLDIAKAMALTLLGQGAGRAVGVVGEKAREAATKARISNAMIIHRQIRPVLDRMMVEHPEWSCADLARELNRLLVPAPRGGKWGYTTIKMIMARPSDWIG